MVYFYQQNKKEPRGIAHQKSFYTSLIYLIKIFKSPFIRNKFIFKFKSTGQMTTRKNYTSIVDKLVLVVFLFFYSEVDFINIQQKTRKTNIYFSLLNYKYYELK